MFSPKTKSLNNLTFEHRKTGTLNRIIFIFIFALLSSCRHSAEKADNNLVIKNKVEIEDATGFTISEYEGFSLLEVNSPWPDAEEPFTYLLYRKDAHIPENLEYDQKIEIPIDSIVVTSTTHIPALEALGVEKSLIGFPGLDYISSPKTRKIIDQGGITDLGQNENLNTEVLINLSPDAVIGFAISSANRSLETIQETGIPVIYNGDWTEKTPLGKAEWIKFFGALYDKLDLANSIYSDIKKEYLETRELAKTNETVPNLIAGSMYNDTWYMPYGNSWQAQFFEDANASYLYANTKGEGSLSLAFESVLEKAEEADYWISSGQYTSYSNLFNESEHYKQFKAVRKKNVYSVSLTKGETGGILYYELAPQRPDLVLKDLVKILHPDLLEGYKLTFYKPLLP